MVSIKCIVNITKYTEYVSEVIQARRTVPSNIL